MGLTDNILAFFAANRQQLVPPRSEGASVLCVGSPDFHVTPAGIERSGLRMVTSEDAEAANAAAGQEYFSLSRALTARVFRELGYEEYAELDLTDRADHRVDLNFPVPPELRMRFDLVWDVGTLEHVMNISQAVENVVAMTRVGGRIVHTQGIGDQTNAGYWTFSPNWFRAFYMANGFRIDVVQLVDRRQHTVSYDEVQTKGSLVGSLIPIRYVPSYYFRLVRHDLVTRLSRRYAGFDRAAILPARVAGKLARLGNVRAGRSFGVLQGIVDRSLGRVATSGPDWSVFMIATRIEELSAFRYPIQAIYRDE